MNTDTGEPRWPDLWSHPPTEDDGGNVVRPAVPLERHLLAVAERARDATSPDAETAGGGSLRHAAEIVGLAHDFGKATEHFQSHVRDDSPDGPTHHARLGGLLAYYALSRRGYRERACFAGLVAVAKHHGSLPDARSFVSTALEQASTWEAWAVDESAYNGHAAEQAGNIDDHRPAFARAVLSRLVGDAGSWAEFRALLAAAGPDDNANTDSNASAAEEGDGLREWLRESFTRSAGRLHPVDKTLFKDGSAYLDELRLYGALTFADKTTAAGVHGDDDRLAPAPLEAADVRDHLASLGTEDADSDALGSRLDAVRSAVQTHVDGRRERDPVAAFLAADSRVATLTLPTGYGKTLTGLLAAARVREATDGDRVVYALPFTSVVDQTADVLRDVLREDAADDPASDRRLTVHHHLSETLTFANDEDEGGDATGGGLEPTDEEMDRAALLAESWRSGVTLTTFVQLFESLAGPRNAQSAKLPALYGSVVVIDEPQALSLSWWPLVDRLVETLTESYGATVVLMTATQPRIVDDDRVFSLLDTDERAEIERDVGAALPARVEYDFRSTALATDDDAVVDYDDAAADLIASVRGTADSALAVCNTIDSASALLDATVDELRARADGRDGFVDVADAFADAVLDDDQFGAPAPDGDDADLLDAFVRAIADAADESKPAVAFLSTRLRPCDRRFLLAAVDALTAEAVPLVVVSTQLVEAGVDVSFDRVARDVAPLDSIVQAAGRCNRSFERAPDPGRVTVWRLAAPGDAERLPSEAVYARRDGPTDADLLAKTREALADVDTGALVTEDVVADRAVRAYHDAVGDAVRTVRADDDLRQSFQCADGATLRAASLVDSPFAFEVYVCRSEADVERVEAYREAERERAFDTSDRLRDDLAEIRVSVPAYRRDSAAARTLVELDVLSVDADRRDATERVWTIDPRFADYFDARTGFDVPESGVDARFL